MQTRDDETLRADPGEQREVPARRGPAAALAVAAALVLALGAAWWWWAERGPPAPAAAPVQAADPAVARSEPPPAEVVPTYPPPSLDPTEAALQPAGIADALADLLGRPAVQRWLLTQDFPRRFVATVDSLGREHAPVLAWPVTPTPGRFTVEEGAGGATIAAANAGRYDPFVALVGAVDAGRAVDLYRRMYPLLQQSYSELGFGQRPFHGRLIEVIDQLLAAPEPAKPPALQLTQVQGPVPSLQPWTRYEFVDPALERLTAGQKMMVRVGLANERRLKLKLRELRAQLLQ